MIGVRSAGRVVEATRGGPLRLIVTGRKRIPTGRVASAKSNRSAPWESTIERDFCVVCEADADVVAFLTQPHRLEIDVGRREPLIYIPDVQLDLAEGQREIVEIKRDADQARPGYAEKLALAREVYTGLGWRHRIVRAAEVRREPRLRNARWIAQDASATVTLAQTRSVVDRVADSGAGTTYGEIAALLGGGPRGRARTHALVVRRVVTLDLDAPIHDDAPLSLVQRRRDA